MSDDSLPPVPSGSSSSNDDTVMLILAYFGIFALIPLLLEKNKPNVQWHAKHGLVLTVTWFVFFVVLMIATTVIAFIPVIGWALGCLGTMVPFIASLGILVLHIMCILKALKGERLLIPHLSQYADRF